MRRLLQWILWCVLGALAVACAGPTSESLSTTQLATPASSEDITPTATLAAPRYVYTPSEFNLLYYPTDLNIVGITGRPQFINAYADW